jgi:hypothetical protein
MLKKDKGGNIILKSIIDNKITLYVLYGVGAIVIIYVGGFVMKIIGNTTLSYKSMNKAFKQ